MKMIVKEWRIPWSLAEYIEEIQQLVTLLQVIVRHTFMESNQLADKLANIALNTQDNLQI